MATLFTYSKELRPYFGLVWPRPMATALENLGDGTGEENGVRGRALSQQDRCSQGYSLREPHTLDCDCGTCDPDDDLHDPRMRIDQLEAALAADADRAAAALRAAGYAGRLLVPRASTLTRGDFLLFPQQHVHDVTDAHGDVRLALCFGTLVVGAANRFVVFRPKRPAPVCDPSRLEHDSAYSPACGADGLSGLERAALTGLNFLGLTSSPARPVDATSIPVGERRGA
jgi:hypothetical protein